MLVSNLETNSFETELVAEIETEPLNNPLKQLFRDSLFCLFVQFFFFTILTHKYAAEFRSVWYTKPFSYEASYIIVC